MPVDLETRINLQAVLINTLTKLPGVGFHPWMEVDVLRLNLLRAQVAEKKPKDILEEWTVKAKRNLVGYWLEYLDQRLVLPIDLEVAEVNGQRRIISKGIKNALWVDSIGSWERNGSVRESAEKIEEFLLSAPPGSAAVLVSPSGDEYPDTQTYIFWVNPENKLECLTIRTDPDIADNELFLFNTDLNFKPNTTAPLTLRVEAIIGNPLFLVAQDGYAFSPESIIETIRATKKSPNAFKSKGFARLFEDLANRHELLENGKTVETVINQFVAYCTRTVASLGYNSDETHGLIENKLGETVLKLSYIKRHLQQKSGTQIPIYELDRLTYHNYYDELRYLQTIPGCAGGGMTTDYINNGFGFRETKWEYHFGVCGICGNQTEVGPCQICRNCEKKF